MLLPADYNQISYVSSLVNIIIRFDYSRYKVAQSDHIKRVSQ